MTYECNGDPRFIIYGPSMLPQKIDDNGNSYSLMPENQLAYINNKKDTLEDLKKEKLDSFCEKNKFSEANRSILQNLCVTDLEIFIKKWDKPVGKVENINYEIVKGVQYAIGNEQLKNNRLYINYVKNIRKLHTYCNIRAKKLLVYNNELEYSGMCTLQLQQNMIMRIIEKYPRGVYDKYRDYFTCSLQREFNSRFNSSTHYKPEEIKKVLKASLSTDCWQSFVRRYGSNTYDVEYYCDDFIFKFITEVENGVIN